MEEVFLHGHEAKLEALPSPRLMHTHLHYSLLPRSLSNSKTVFVCRYVFCFVFSFLSIFLYQQGMSIV
jgi:pyrrolidone-carboxylate peptidase